MNKLTTQEKAALSKDDQALRESGFISSDFTITGSGEQALTALLAEKYKKELVEAAKTAIAEEVERLKNHKSCDDCGSAF